MKNLKNLLAITLCISLIISAGLFGAGAAPKTNTTPAHDYTITSPYKDVNWDTWKALKAALHTHTIASDGKPNIDESVEMHYALDYDIFAITDHMVNAAPWNEVPKTVPIMTLVSRDRNQGKALSPLTDTRYREILTGVGRDGRGMLDVPLGVELNGAVPLNTHVNGLFANYGQGLIGVSGDYETPIRETEKAGGITFLNHLGSFTGAWDRKKDPNISRQPKYVNKFARIFLDYPTCIAMDINSSKDSSTRYDRILWDEVLQKTIPNGRNVSCITFSDSHALDQSDRAFTIMMEPENTLAALRTCLETGAYFGISRYARAELGTDFRGEGPTPLVTRITVDQNEDKITLTGENYNAVTWVSNGEIIATGESIDLNDHADLGCYVRAYLTGPGGICYTQAFVITAPDIDWGTPYVPAVTLDYSYFLRGLQTFLDELVLQHSIIFKVARRILIGL